MGKTTAIVTGAAVALVCAVFAQRSPAARPPGGADAVKAGVDRVVILGGKTYLTGELPPPVGKKTGAATVAWSWQDANHPPAAALDHDADLNATPGATVKLSAKGSKDPDGDKLSYKWWQYREPGSYPGVVEIRNADRQQASFKVPDDARKGHTVHIICDVTDNGDPPLTRYRRVIVTFRKWETGRGTTSDLAGGLHPVNKSGNGRRACRVALGFVYGRDVAIYGPTYKSHTIEGNKIRVRFKHVGKGLAFRHGKKLQGFEIAGADDVYHWADARIEGDTVVVSSDETPKPVHVRYGCSNHRSWANLFNKDGLPALTFRTGK